jgi:hypothetical protein
VNIILIIFKEFNMSLQSWVFPATNNTVQISPNWAATDTATNSFFNNQLSFSFFNDAQCTQPSSSPTGLINITGRASTLAIFQPIMTGFNISNPITLAWNGVTSQLAFAPLSVTRTNYIKIFFERGQ